MSRTRSRNTIERDAVAIMLQAAGLEHADERLDELADLLNAARDAATHLDEAAGRVPLSEALSEFNPAWLVEERRP